MSVPGLFAKSRFNVESHYLNKDTADVFFICGDETKERIPAHKILLAGSSNVFDKMFYGTLNEVNDIKIVDATPNGFRQFLRFFYFHDLEFSLLYIDQVMYLAKKYLIESYFVGCCKFLSEHKEVEGILIGFEQSIRFQLGAMRKQMEASIENNAYEVFNSDCLALIDRDLLKHAIQIPAMRTDYVKHAFDGCIAWAEAACRRVDIDATVMENLRDQLGDCFDHILFCSMSRDEIAYCVEKFGDLFTAQELQQLVVITLSKCPSNMKPSFGTKIIHSIFTSTPPTDDLVSVSKGSCENLQFIAKRGMMLNAISVNEWVNTNSFFESRCLVNIYKIRRNKSERILILKECFPVDGVFEFREAIFLEQCSVYSIEIMFSSSVSYNKLEVAQAPCSLIEILPGTDTNFIVSLDLYVNI